ncbi:queuosine precursor transporter [Methanosphaera sp.]
MSWNLDYTDKRVVITAIFCMAFTIANLITVKIIDLNIFGLEVPAGVLIYPLVYILTNVITEVYGEETARRTLILGIGADVLFVFMTTLMLFLPSPGWYTGDSSLAFVFTQTPRILVASYISYLAGNLVNARVTTIVNRGTSYLTLKNYGAISLGELVDNILFIGLAFIGTVPLIDVAIMIFSHWVISLIWCAIAQPFTNKTVKWAAEGKPVEA